MENEKVWFLSWGKYKDIIENWSLWGLINAEKWNLTGLASFLRKTLKFIPIRFTFFEERIASFLRLFGHVP